MENTEISTASELGEGIQQMMRNAGVQFHELATWASHLHHVKDFLSNYSSPNPENQTARQLHEAKVYLGIVLEDVLEHLNPDLEP